MYAIEAMNGPLDGKRWPFERDITIGRDESAVDAALPTDRAVSRRHARVSVAGTDVELTDSGSSNGTLVSGQPIAQTVRIAFGQPFRVGTTMLRVLESADDR